MNANRGYVGWSRSVRASEAERDGKLPLSRAVKEVAKFCGITQKQARAVCLLIGRCEWHHTSKHFNATDYYDVGDIDEKIAFAKLAPRMPQGWEERITAACKSDDMATRLRLAAEVRDALAAESGVSADEINEMYYGNATEIADLL